MNLLLRTERAKSVSLVSRRSLLQGAGCAVTAATFPLAFRLAAATSVRPVMEKLCSYMSEASERGLPEDVAEKTKQHILDTIAAMISGSVLGPGQAAIKFARGYGGEKVSSVVASDVVCGPIEAALANGVLAHSDETDDSHRLSESHPGCAVIPAALAAGERFRISGRHFLHAVALGYDIGPRFTMSILETVDFQSDAHKSTYSVAGVFGAAAAAGCAANLSTQQMRWLIDYAAQQSSGISAWQRDSEHTEKAFVYGGMPARSGVTAALLVHSGWTGIDDILSGDDNFFLAYAPKTDPGGLVKDLGTRYEVTRTNIKKWCVGSPIQAVLDALETILKKHPFEAENVQQVAVRLAVEEISTVNNSNMPDVCVQHLVALMLIEKTIAFRAAHDRGRMQDAAIIRQRAKVKLIPDEELEKNGTVREAIVEVTLNDGSRYREHVTAVRGTVENPMSSEEVIAKAGALISPIIGEAKSKKLIENIFSLDSLKDVLRLRPLLMV